MVAEEALLQSKITAEKKPKFLVGMALLGRKNWAPDIKKGANNKNNHAFFFPNQQFFWSLKLFPKKKAIF